MPKSKPGRAGGKEQKIGQINFRLADRHRAELDELADYLGTDRSGAHRLAVQALRERLGLVRRDAIAAVEAIVRMSGDDAAVRCTIKNIQTGEAFVSIAGKRVSGWTGWVFTALDPDTMEPRSSSGAHIRHDESNTGFGLGVIEEPHDGAFIEVRAADLPDLVTLSTEGKSPRRLRDDFRADVELRRQLHDVLDAHGGPGDD
jgi:hypothetical protein